MEEESNKSRREDEYTSSTNFFRIPDLTVIYAPREDLPTLFRITPNTFVHREIPFSCNVFLKRKK